MVALHECKAIECSCHANSDSNLDIRFYVADT